MRRLLWLSLSLLLVIPSAWAMRSKKPPTFSDLKDTNQLTELNQVLEDGWQIQNGRYTLENIVTDPNGTRKGLAGDLVYAIFGGLNHLCINTSLRADPTPTDWTCINIGTLSTCPGGADGMVQFNDNGTCGGDAAFLWEKNLNHAALDGDGTATIDDTVTHSTFLSGSSDTATQVINVRDTRTDIATTFHSSVLGEMDWTPSGTPSAGTKYAEGLTGILHVNAGALVLDNQKQGHGVYGVAEYTGTDATASSRSEWSGVRGIAENIGTGRVGLLTGGRFQTLQTNGTTNTMAGLYVESSDKVAGTITTSYGALIEAFNAPGDTTNIALGVYTGAPSAGLSTEQMILETDGTARVSSGSTIANQRFNVFQAPTINGVAGGATETVTNAATVYNSGPPSGSNITFTNGPWGEWLDCTVDGDCLNLLLSNSQAAGAGSTNETIQIRFGLGSETDNASIVVGKGSDYTTGNASDSFMDFYTDNSATLTRAIRIDDAQQVGIRTIAAKSYLSVNGNVGIGSTYAGTNAAPTDGLIVQGQTGIGTAGTPSILGELTVGDSAGQAALYIRGKSSNASPAQLYLNDENDSDIVSLAWINTTTGSPPVGPAFELNIDTGIKAFVFVDDESRTTDFALEDPSFISGSTTSGNLTGQSLVVDSGTTIANQRQNWFIAPTLNGVAGGATETITNSATLYIDAAPSGSNITFTNGPYALWVDDGAVRLDGTTTVSGIIVQDTLTSTNTGSLGWSLVTGANTACNTTCTSACVHGWDTAAGEVAVNCTDATADKCLCAGQN